jgi:hypothetical protein
VIRRAFALRGRLDVAAVGAATFAWLAGAWIAVGCTVGPIVAVGSEGGVSGDASATDANDESLLPLDGSVCEPRGVQTFVPMPYRPATNPWQGVCTMQQLQGFYAACIDSTASTASCHAFSQQADNAACSTCILTPENANNYGPLIDHMTFITPNVGGCIELTDPSGLPCAKAQQALAGCELAACEAYCPVTDATSRAALDQCTATAAGAGCQMFAVQASCSQAIAEAGASSVCVGKTFRAFYDAVVPLFCGPPPDAAAAPYEAGDEDAGAGADASSGDAAAADGSTEASSLDGSWSYGGDAGDAPSE